MRAKKQAMDFYPITVSSAVHIDGTSKNLKEDYSETRSEIEYARTATTGEKFNTIDERLDHEINRLKKGYGNITLLEQDDKERHSIHNTCEGLIQDLIIKGKTLMNLIKDGEGTRTIDKTINENRIHYFNLTHYLKRGKKYTGYVEINSIESSAYGLRIYGLDKKGTGNGGYFSIGKGIGKIKFIWDTNTISESINEIHTIGLYLDNDEFNNGGKVTFSNFMLFEEGTDFITLNNYISDTESFGQKEGKVSILVHGKNLWNKEVFVPKLLDLNSWETNGAYRFNDQNIYLEKAKYSITNQDIIVPPGLYPVLGIRHKGDPTTVGGIFPGGVYTNQHGDTPKLVPKRATTMPVSTEDYYHFNGIYLGGWTQENINKYQSMLESDIQIEYGTISTQYEPYKENRLEILLPQYGFEEGLRGINSFIYDELNYIRNVAIKRIEKYIVTGNENFMIDIRNDHMYCYFILEGCKPGSGRDAICNQFNYVDALWDKDKVENQGREGFDLSGTNSLTFQILLSKLETQDVEGVKKYFKTLYDEGNPVIIYYELAKPIETPLKETINLTSYNKDTYILFENNIGGTSNFKIPIDISKTINSLLEERQTLENEVVILSNEINQIKTYMIQVLSNNN